LGLLFGCLVCCLVSCLAQRQTASVGNMTIFEVTVGLASQVDLEGGLFLLKLSLDPMMLKVYVRLRKQMALFSCNRL